MKASVGLLTPWALQVGRAQLESQFRYKLGDNIRYEWRWIPKGEPLYYTEFEGEVLAERDYVEVVAFNGD